jgi:hypothetical protein
MYDDETHNKARMVSRNACKVSAVKVQGKGKEKEEEEEEEERGTGHTETGRSKQR